MATLPKEFTEDLGNEISDQQNEFNEQLEANMKKAAVKRQIQRKQIRALRNQFRPAGGFLQPGGRGVAIENLGQSTGLPNKLGNA
jgi:hypothetical protein